MKVEHSRLGFFLSAFSSIILAAAALFWLYGLLLQHEASSLLSDVKSLRVGITSRADAERLIARHRMEQPKIICEDGVCNYSFVVSNRLLSWTHAEPPAEFRTGFTVVQGTVTHIYAGLTRSMPRYPTFMASAGGVDEYDHLPWYDSKMPHYGFPTPVGKPYLRVLLDRHADAVQREHAFSFSFACLTKTGGGCDMPCDYLPEAWQDWRIDLQKGGLPASDFDTAYPKNARCKRF